MRIATMLNEPTGSDPVGELKVTIERAAADGLASVWMPNIFGVDTLTALAVAGSQVPDIELATGVVPIYPRHPSVLAQQALTVQAAVGGRLTLGIGLSHQVVVENMWGYPFERPAKYMDEYLSCLLPLLSDGSASFTGQMVKAQLAVSIPRPHPVPVLLAALAPRMLRLAGERTDGTVLWMTGPETIRRHVVPAITAAAEAGGRPSPRVVCALPVCVTDDVSGARERASEVFAVYGHLPSYRAMLDREGAEGPADVAIVGDEATVKARIEDVAAAGATDFVGAEFGTGDDAVRTRSLLKSLTASVASGGLSMS